MKGPDPKPLNLILLPILFASCIAVQAESADSVQEGVASYYANMLHGNRTATGGSYDKNALTAAHRKLPFGTRIKVTYLKTGKSVIVKINDRGPFAKGRLIDLSDAAAKKIGLTDDGHGKVRLEILAQ